MTAENQPAASGLPPQSDKDDFNAHESLVDGLVVVSVSGLARWDSVVVHGPVVKATTTTTIAGSNQSAVR